LPFLILDSEADQPSIVISAQNDRVFMLDEWQDAVESIMVVFGVYMWARIRWIVWVMVDDYVQ